MIWIRTLEWGLGTSLGIFLAGARSVSMGMVLGLAVCELFVFGVPLSQFSAI